MVKDAKYQRLTSPRGPTTAPPDHEDTTTKDKPRTTSSPAKGNWQRATQIVKRAEQEDGSASDSDVSSEPGDDGLRKAVRKKDPAQVHKSKTAKMMDLQYFLELVDQKHRHGSNLRKYHAHWQQADTRQNFFYWLDQGDGKDLDLEECSRERLNKMQVRYLSRDERQNYMVKIDPEGMLIWAKNGERVWTKDELFKDSIHGIVPTNDSTPRWQYNVRPENESSSDSDVDSNDKLEETNQADEGERYIDEEFHRARGPAKLKYVSAGVVFNHMMRQSLKKGHKWIFVSDRSFNLYIG